MDCVTVWRRRGLRLASVVLALLGLAGCGGCNGKHPAGGSCETAGNCQSGECAGGVCTDCTRGANACVCTDSNTCDTGLSCNGGVCGACAEGSASCPCRGNGMCDTGLRCSAGTCVAGACVDGTTSCPCRAGNLCDTGLTCTANNTCATCSNDLAGCPCTAGACRASLVCDLGTTTCRAAATCTSLGCASAHRRCAAGTPGTDARCLEDCETGYTWNSVTMACDPVANANCTGGAPGSILADCDTQNRACTPNGNSASCTACKATFTDVGGSLVTCRAVVTCATLSSTCDAQDRECTPAAANADAVCGGCKTGFTMMSNICVAIPSGSCVVDAGGGLEETCTTRGRECVETVPGQASCGVCFPGLMSTGADPLPCVAPQDCGTLNCAALNRVCDANAVGCGACITGLVPTAPGSTTSACRLPVACSALSCATREYCNDSVANQDAVCAARPCSSAMQAFRQDTNACVGCTGTCGINGSPGNGETGLYWPFTALNSNRCICETQAGFFVETGGAFSARPCDEDQDGWVNDGAQSAVEGNDPTLRSNARCSVRRVDRIVLENEYHERRDILLCDTGPVDGTQGACATPAPLPLYETARNDQQLEIDNAVNADYPQYTFNGVGRRLRASELTPLTKACKSSTADHNDNGISDVDEHQNDPTLAGRLGQFGYFMELHTSGFEPPTSTPFGRLLIKERSRCEMGFPVQYEATADLYWKNCQRRRDAAYRANPQEPSTIGFDFARWSCASAQGSCPTAPPPAMPPAQGAGAVPPHGLCEVSLPPADDFWRGMNHHSQFKCVVINPNDQMTAAGQQSRRKSTDLHNSGNADSKPQFNHCRVECPVADPLCNTDCTFGGCTVSSVAPESPLNAINPDNALFTCTPVNASTVLNDNVGFIAVRQAPDGIPYATGCINEYDETDGMGRYLYRELCPGYLDNMAAINGDSNTDEFGRMICGCNLNFGGEACDIPCVNPDLFTQPGYNAATRFGYWMCATPAASSNPELQGGGYNLHGQIPARLVPTTSLCQDIQNCNTGYAVTPF